MDKEIIKAYGEYWENMKPYVDLNGWFNKIIFYKETFKFKYDDFDHKGDLMRPKSLKGFEVEA